jgi:hypothetical protein
MPLSGRSRSRRMDLESTFRSLEADRRPAGSSLAAHTGPTHPDAFANACFCAVNSASVMSYGKEVKSRRPSCPPGRSGPAAGRWATVLNAVRRAHVQLAHSSPSPARRTPSGSRAGRNSGRTRSAPLNGLPCQQGAVRVDADLSKLVDQILSFRWKNMFLLPRAR